MRLYVVTRQDLGPGAQAVQACRAITQFRCDYPELGVKWFAQKNSLMMVLASDEAELRTLLLTARDKDIRVSAFHVTGMKTQLVALAFESSMKTRRLLSKMPLLV